MTGNSWVVFEGGHSKFDNMYCKKTHVIGLNHFYSYHESSKPNLRSKSPNKQRTPIKPSPDTTIKSPFSFQFLENLCKTKWRQCNNGLNYHYSFLANYCDSYKSFRNLKRDTWFLLSFKITVLSCTFLSGILRGFSIDVKNIGFLNFRE
jgi:hypothetical protein